MLDCIQANLKLTWRQQLKLWLQWCRIVCHQRDTNSTACTTRRSKGIYYCCDLKWISNDSPYPPPGTGCWHTTHFSTNISGNSHGPSSVDRKRSNARSISWLPQPHQAQTCTGRSIERNGTWSIQRNGMFRLWFRWHLAIASPGYPSHLCGNRCMKWGNRWNERIYLLESTYDWLREQGPGDGIPLFYLIKKNVSTL